MRADALAQVAALADVERQRIEAVEEVDAGRLGQRVDRVGRELRRQARRPQHAPRGLLDRLGRKVAVERLHERPEHARVAERAMAPVDGGSPWRAITLSRLWRGSSGKSRRESRTVHSTRAVNVRSSRANACFRNP